MIDPIVIVIVIIVGIAGGHGCGCKIASMALVRSMVDHL
jgi:hypothetical protein